MKKYVFRCYRNDLYSTLILRYNEVSGMLEWKMAEPYSLVDADCLFSALYNCTELRKELTQHHRMGPWFTDLRNDVQVVVSNTNDHYKVAPIFMWQDVTDEDNDCIVDGGCWIRDIYDVLAVWVRNGYEVKTTMAWEITEQYDKDVARLNSAESWSPNMGFDLDDLEYQDVDEDILYQ